MPHVRATASAVIPAPPGVVYGILADYRVGHPSILPPRYFRNLRVLEGGTGAGTRIAFQIVVWGSTRDVQATITEPAPGRTLVETTDDGTETAFTVASRSDGRSSLVTIATAYRRAGIRGWIESVLAPAFLRPVYAAELHSLSEVAGREGRTRA